MCARCDINHITIKCGDACLLCVCVCWRICVCSAEGTSKCALDLASQYWRCGISLPSTRWHLCDGASLVVVAILRFRNATCIACITAPFVYIYSIYIPQCECILIYTTHTHTHDSQNHQHIRSDIGDSSTLAFRQADYIAILCWSIV